MMSASQIAVWLYLNLLPFSLLGIALAFLAMRERQTPMIAAATRLVVGLLLASTLATTAIAASLHPTLKYAPSRHRMVVVYDPCKDPNYPAWLWWLTCVL